MAGRNLRFRSRSGWVVPALVLLQSLSPVFPPRSPLPPIDLDFLDENGRLKQWLNIAAIIRERFFAEEGDQPCA